MAIPRIGNDLLRPLRALKPQEDNVGVMSYLAAQAAGGFLQAPVAHFQTDLYFFPNSAGPPLRRLQRQSTMRLQRGKVIILPLHGAISRVDSSDMAFALRQPGYEVDVAGVWGAPAEKADAVRWVKALRDNLQPFAHGVYVNQLGDTSEELVRAAYGPNYPRLVEIKKKY